MTTRTNAIASAIAGSAMLFATPAVAVDGEILIDQAKVNAGGITPGDAPGFPATLSTPGRYKLVGNLKVPSDNSGIVVTADDVTIDLSGFTISSNPPGEAAIGVSAVVTTNGLRVINGTITGFRNFGVANRTSQGAQFAVIENMRIIFNGTGIFVGPYAQIRNSTVANSPRGNISCLRTCLIEGSVITGAANGAGISMTGGTVLGNVVVSNKIGGLIADQVEVGYGNNILVGNNSGGAQVRGPAVQLHPNVCDPACP
jgi:hypothetical protein